jgi:hypothetical protein
MGEVYGSGWMWLDVHLHKYDVVSFGHSHVLRCLGETDCLCTSFCGGLADLSQGCSKVASQKALVYTLW